MNEPSRTEGGLPRPRCGKLHSMPMHKVPNYWPANQTIGYSCDFTYMLLTCLQDS